jgi:histidinol-phosphate aminotransferase
VTQEGVGERAFGHAGVHAIPPCPPTRAPAALPLADGVRRIVNLSLNEGSLGPFPSALAAMTEVAGSANRYPSRGSYDLTGALAAHLHVSSDEVVVAAGGDAVIGYVAQAALEPGDEVVLPWPSFPSFLRDPQKRGAVPVTVPLTAYYDVDFDALLDAVGPHTRLVFVATPNNPTGRPVPSAALRSFVEALPAHVLPVVDEAYVEYLEPDQGDAIRELYQAGGRVLVIRSFSKLFGLAGLRVGYGVGPTDVVDAIRRVQRGYDVNALAQAAALASLDDPEEVTRRRAATRASLALLEATLRARGLEPVPGAAANFVLVPVGATCDALVTGLLERGVVVQPAAPFGAPGAIRITAGAPDEIEALGLALDALRALVP